MTIEEFFGTLQESITAEWRKHLQTNKYSEHMGLDEFYKEMPEKVDALIEAWQADNDIVKDYKNILDEGMDALEYLEKLKKLTKEGRELLGSSELESLTDDILSLIDSTIYKLKHLKESMPSLMDCLQEALGPNSLAQSFNEGLLDAEFDIKEADILIQLVHDFCAKITPSGGNRYGNVDAEWYDDEWVPKFNKALASMFKKCSTAKAKTNWDSTSFIVAAAPKIDKFWRGHYDFRICMPEKLESSTSIFGVSIHLCPDFRRDHDAKSSLSARGSAGLTVYPIPTELAIELCKVCQSEFPKRA